MAQDPFALLLCHRHTAEVGAVDPRIPVVPREALIQERVIGPRTGPARCGLPSAHWRTASPFPGGSPGAGCRRSRGTHSNSDGHCAGYEAAATARRSLRRTAPAFGSASMRFTSDSRTLGWLSCPFDRQTQQLYRPECSTTRRTKGATQAPQARWVQRARLQLARDWSRRGKVNDGLASMRRSAICSPPSAPARFRPVIEFDQRSHIFIRERTPIRPASKGFEKRSHARPSIPAHDIVRLLGLCPSRCLKDPGS